MHFSTCDHLMLLSIFTHAKVTCFKFQSQQNWHCPVTDHITYPGPGSNGSIRTEVDWRYWAAKTFSLFLYRVVILPRENIRNYGAEDNFKCTDCLRPLVCTRTFYKNFFAASRKRVDLATKNEIRQATHHMVVYTSIADG